MSPRRRRRGQVNFRSHNSCLSLGASSPGRRRACVLFGVFFRGGYSPTGLPDDTVWLAFPPSGWGWLSMLLHSVEQQGRKATQPSSGRWWCANAPRGDLLPLVSRAASGAPQLQDCQSLAGSMADGRGHGHPLGVEVPGVGRDGSSPPGGGSSVDDHHTSAGTTAAGCSGSWHHHFGSSSSRSDLLIISVRRRNCPGNRSTAQPSPNGRRGSRQSPGGNRSPKHM